MNWFIAISTTVVALATVGMFVFTWLNFWMYKELQKKQDEQQQRFQDLFEGIVIATLMSGPTSNYPNYTACKMAFLKEYKGGTRIFNG